MSKYNSLIFLWVIGFLSFVLPRLFDSPLQPLTDKSPAADTEPPVTRIFTLSVKYGWTGRIGKDAIRTLARKEGGSTEKTPPTATVPSRATLPEKESFPLRFLSVETFSAVIRRGASDRSTGGSVVPSTKRTAYRSIAAFRRVITHDFSGGTFFPDFPSDIVEAGDAA